METLLHVPLVLSPGLPCLALRILSKTFFSGIKGCILLRLGVRTDGGEELPHTKANRSFLAS